MIILDTNVVSEPWKPTPDPNVLAWLDAQPAERLYLSAVTVAEIRFGLATMPDSKRRALFEGRFEQEIVPAFAGRVLPFDLDATRAYAALMARARSIGRAVGMADGYIAAIAITRNMSVATRDRTPFEIAGVPTYDPWTEAL